MASSSIQQKKVLSAGGKEKKATLPMGELLLIAAAALMLFFNFSSITSIVHSLSLGGVKTVLNSQYMIFGAASFVFAIAAASCLLRDMYPKTQIICDILWWITAMLCGLRGALYLIGFVSDFFSLHQTTLSVGPSMYGREPVLEIIGSMSKFLVVLAMLGVAVCVLYRGKKIPHLNGFCTIAPATALVGQLYLDFLTGEKVPVAMSAMEALKTIGSDILLYASYFLLMQIVLKKFVHFTPEEKKKAEHLESLQQAPKQA